MLFTQEQIEEIIKRISITGIKDTQFPEATLPLKGNELITLIQGGENKIAALEELGLGKYSYPSISEEELIEIFLRVETELNY